MQRFGFIGSFPSPLEGEGRVRGKRIWLHAASVGEFNACEVLIKKLKSDYPHYEIVISTNTPSAQKLVKKNYPELRSFFFPIDLTLIIHRVLNHIQPDLIILIEQELWVNLLRIADKKRIPVILLNGRMTARSAKRYGWIKPVISAIWYSVEYFCVQNEDYAKRFQALGVPAEKIKVTGNMKYDAISSLVQQFTSSVVNYKELFGFKADDLVIIAGSTHAPEEEIILETYAKLQKEIPNLRLAIAPRHPFRFDEVDKLIKAKGFESLRRSGITQSSVVPRPRVYPEGTEGSIVLLDSLGELTKVYSIADIVFVGGSLINHGGQSILEPAAMGKPSIFGPDMSNFQDIADIMIKEKAVVSVTDRRQFRFSGLLPTITRSYSVTESCKEKLYQELLRLLKQPTELKAMGSRAQAIIKRYQGATDKNVEIIKRILK